MTTSSTPPFEAFSIRGLWDCKRCFNANGLDATHVKHCPKCGGQFQKEWQYPDPEMKPITDRGELMIAEGGPNWTCGHCSADNFETAVFCIDCGAGKDSGEVREDEVFLEKPPVDSDESERQARQRADKLRQQRQKSLRSQTPTVVVKPTRASKTPPQINFDIRSITLPVAVVLGVATVALLIWAFFFNVHDVPVQLASPHWTVSQGVEEFQRVNGEGFSMPPDATQDSVGKEVSGYGQKRGDDLVEKVPTKEWVTTGWGKCTVDQGNNTYKVEPCATQEYKITGYGEQRTPRYTPVPTYSPYYHYHQMKWVSVLPVSTSGNDFNPVAPFVTTTNTRRPSGNPTYSYSATFRDREGKQYPSINFSESSWRALKYEMWYTGKINTFGVLVGIEPPK